jgi:hypothetical protein
LDTAGVEGETLQGWRERHCRGGGREQDRHSGSLALIIYGVRVNELGRHELNQLPPAQLLLLADILR